MPSLITVELIAILLGLGLVGGFAYKLLSGRGRKVSSSEVVSLQKLKATKNNFPIYELGSQATLLLFSTQYCGQCPGVKRQLAQLEYRNGGLLFIEVDITERLDLAAHFSVGQTPTVFILDPTGRIRFRVGGVPKPGVISHELEKLGI
jgi:thiol-disulfide isomerase/thioredoxin